MEWIKERHYLKSAPPGHVLVLEFREGRDRVGMMQIGRPSARTYDANRILELNRMYFVDEAPKNTESRALAMMRRHVRTWFPSIRLLISYSDPAHGHTGAVYEADGWAPLGMTSSGPGMGWKSRANRRDVPNSKKQRWVRTP